MKINEILENAKNPLISYEFIPPKRGVAFKQVLDLIEALVPFDPPFIDVTSHSAEVYYEELPNGIMKRSVKRKRPGTLGMCAAIKGRYGIETVPHLLCKGFTREETEDALIELNYLGIQNVMALRGDESNYKKPLNGVRTQNEYASDLVEQIMSMNEGHYLEDLIDATPTDFCVGVAGYPEKHFEAPNGDWDIKMLKKKVDAGASYITTQMFFDNKVYFDFVEKCRSADITVPIIPGLKILTSKRQLKSLPSFFHIDLPTDLVGAVEEAKPEHVVDVGVEWAIKQSEEILSAGVPYLHFYIMLSSRAVTQVVSKLYEKA